MWKQHQISDSFSTNFNLLTLLHIKKKLGYQEYGPFFIFVPAEQVGHQKISFETFDSGHIFFCGVLKESTFCPNHSSGLIFITSKFCRVSKM